jgi:hypothetical protein
VGRAAQGELFGWQCKVAITPNMRWGLFYRRIQARAGAPKAVVATARKLAERVYRLLKYGAEYVCQKIEAYEAAYKARLVKGLARRAAELGYRLEPTATAGT